MPYDFSGQLKGLALKNEWRRLGPGPALKNFAGPFLENTFEAIFVFFLHFTPEVARRVKLRFANRSKIDRILLKFANTFCFY